MTPAEQRTYWLQYAKQSAKMERLAREIVLDLFRDRLTAIYAYLNAYGLEATRDQLDILFTKLHVQDMYSKLYMEVGTRQKQWADADVARRFPKRKGVHPALALKDDDDDARREEEEERRRRQREILLALIGVNGRRRQRSRRRDAPAPNTPSQPTARPGSSITPIDADIPNLTPVPPMTVAPSLLAPLTDITPTFGVGFFNDAWLARLRNLYTGSEVGKRVTSVTKTIKDKIRNSLTESSQQFVSISKTITKLKRDVGGVFARQRAELIARTEVTYVNNLAAEQSAKETAQSVGIDLVKVWIRTLDDRTRDSHWNAPTKPIKAEEKFKIGPKKKLMDKPGDPAGGLAEIINCRCVVSYMPADDHEDLLNEDGEFQSVPRRLSLEEQAEALADAALNDPEFMRQIR